MGLERTQLIHVDGREGIRAFVTLSKTLPHCNVRGRLALTMELS